MGGAITIAAPRRSDGRRALLPPLPLALRRVAAWVASLASAAILASCAAAPAPVAPVRVAPTPVPPPPPRLPAWTYWEPVDVPVNPGVSAATLPLAATSLNLTNAAEARWTAQPQALRDGVLRRGFAVTRPARPAVRIGEVYASLRDDGVPWVVTLDSLFFLAHMAMDRACADVEELVVRPSLLTLLQRLDAGLMAGSRGAPADVASAYLVARGVVDVALALLIPDFQPPKELAALVEGERSRAIAHSAPGVSPWLGVPIDYSALSPRGQADRDEPHAGPFRAMAWLQGAGLALEGRGEDDVRMPVDVATARTHARAAALLSRLVQHDVDPEAASAWARIARAGDLLVGQPDDATPRDLSAAEVAAHLDPTRTDWLADITAVDRVRRATARARVARLDDGAGGAFAPAVGMDMSRSVGRIAPTFRLVAPRFTPDSEVLQSLVFPGVGLLSRTEPPRTARDGRRALPSALDVGAWLGSAEARAALRASGDDAYSNYAETLERLIAARPTAAIERHRTPYLSSLDALATWLGPSMGDRVQPSAATPEWRSRKAAVALAAWTEQRHDVVPLARVERPAAHPGPRTAPAGAAPIFVEPHPEAIASLLALLRQTSRALIADGAITPGGPAQVALQEVQDLLWDALGVASAEASDQPVAEAMLAALASFPARMRALEESLGDPGGADVRLAVDVHADPSSGTVLEEATGPVEELWMAMREPGTHRLWLALGASIPHLERIEPMAARLSDPAWAARVADETPPPEPLERAYFEGSR